MRPMTSARRSHSLQQTLPRVHWALFAALLVLLLFAGLALADKPADPVASWPVVALDGDQTQADIAYSPDFDQFLLAFLSHEGDDWNIYGQILDGEGFVISPITPIALGGGEERGHPAVAYNSATREFLVVWEETFLNQDWDVRGLRLTATGVPIGDDFAVAARGNPERQPDVAYNSVRNEYVVIWKQVVGEGDSAMPDISGQRLNAMGEPIDSDFPITFGATDESFPRLAYDKNANQYLVVWQEAGAGNDVDVRGQRVAWDGSWLGGVMDIAANDWIQKSPVVAYAPAAHQFLVVWAEQADETHRNIIAQRYASAGAAVGGRISVSTGTNDFRDAPAVTFNPTKNAFLVAWEYVIDQEDQDILIRYVNTDGSMPQDEYPVSSALGIEARPAVAAGSDDSYLVVWEQEGDGNKDLYASVLKSPETPPTPTPTPTATATPTATPAPRHRLWLPVTLSP